MSASTSSGGSAGGAVRDALAAALRGQPGLAGIAVVDGRSGSPALPRIEVGEPAGADWSAKEMLGREVRTAVTVRAAAGQAGRVAVLTQAAERAGEALTGSIGGWRVAGAVFLRSRGAEDKNGDRTVLIEHRVRVIEE